MKTFAKIMMFMPLPFPLFDVVCTSNTRYSILTIDQYQIGEKDYTAWVAQDMDEHADTPNILTPITDPGYGWGYAGTQQMFYNGPAYDEYGNLDPNSTDHATGQIIFRWTYSDKDTGSGTNDQWHWYLWVNEYAQPVETCYGITCTTPTTSSGYDTTITMNDWGTLVCNSGLPYMRSLDHDQENSTDTGE